MDKNILDHCLELHLPSGGKSDYMLLLDPDGDMAGMYDLRDKNDYDKLILEYTRLYDPKKYSKMVEEIDYKNAKKEKYVDGPFFFRGECFIDKSFYEHKYGKPPSYGWKATFVRPREILVGDVLGLMYDLRVSIDSVQVFSQTNFEFHLKDFYEANKEDGGQWVEDRSIAYLIQ